MSDRVTEAYKKEQTLQQRLGQLVGQRDGMTAQVQEAETKLSAHGITAENAEARLTEFQSALGTAVQQYEQALAEAEQYVSGAQA